MKYFLTAFIFCIHFTVSGQVNERVKLIDSLIQSNKFKSVRQLTKRGEQNTTYYGQSRDYADVWIAVEQNSKRRGAPTDESIRFCFQFDDLLAIEVWMRQDDCPRCKCIYYFLNNELIFKKEETGALYKPELLEKASTHLKTFSLYAYRTL